MTHCGVLSLSASLNPARGQLSLTPRAVSKGWTEVVLVNTESVTLRLTSEHSDWPFSVRVPCRARARSLPRRRYTCTERSAIHRRCRAARTSNGVTTAPGRRRLVLPCLGDLSAISVRPGLLHLLLLLFELDFGSIRLRVGLHLSGRDG